MRYELVRGGCGVRFAFVGGREFDFIVQSRANSGVRRERKLSVQKAAAFCVG